MDIAWLKGRVLEVESGRAVVAVGGVGYRVFVPPQVRAGEDAELHVRTVVREDGVFLYGFSDPVAMRLFDRLQRVRGVGAQAAYSLVTVLGPGELMSAVADGDVESLAAVRGVGKKTAELICALADLSGLQGGDLQRGLAAEAAEALAGLGYTRQEALAAARKAVTRGAETLEDAVRLALEEAGCRAR